MATRKLTAEDLKSAANIIVKDGRDGFESAAKLIGRPAATELLDVFENRHEYLFRNGTSVPHDPKIEIELLRLFSDRCETPEEDDVINEAIVSYNPELGIVS